MSGMTPPAVGHLRLWDSESAATPASMASPVTFAHTKLRVDLRVRAPKLHVS